VRIRRQAGRLSWLETELLVVAYRAQRNGHPDFHGYRAAQLVPGAPSRQSVYEALNRLAAFGFVTRRWEDADVHLERRRPRRLLYRITDAGRMAALPAVLGARVMGRRPPGPLTHGRLPPPAPGFSRSDPPAG
jgi:hypothetical protein